MEKIKSVLSCVNKKTFTIILAIIAVMSAMLFSGVNLLNQGNKGAAIQTPEISTNIDSQVSAADISGSINYGPTWTVKAGTGF